MSAKKTPKFQYHKGDYVVMKQQAQSMSWTPEGESSIEEKWHQFMNNIKHLMDKHIPKSRSHMQNERKRPIYMTAKTREKVRLKKAAFSTWRCTRSGQDYKQYTKVINQAKTGVS